MPPLIPLVEKPQLENAVRKSVYYTVEGEEIRIYAVVDCRRDPSWIEGHLE